MKPLYKLFLAAILLAPFTAFAQATTGDLKVTVVNEKSEPVPGAIVSIVSGGDKKGGATDMDGIFTFRALNPGTYSVDARLLGYKHYTKTGIIVNTGQTAYADFSMQVLANADTEVVVVAEAGPVSKEFTLVHNINAEQLKHNAGGRSDMMSLVEGTTSEASIGKNGQLVMRGSREGASTMYIDGEKVYGDAGIPGGSIQQVTVLSGGIPAAFGDMTGGIVIITTKDFETGYYAKVAMYEAAAEEEAAAKKAALEKSGQLIDKDGEIIEKQKEPTPAPQQTPAGGGN
jgi:rRNA processing protein Gar1